MLSNGNHSILRESELAELIADCYDDPLGFVMAAYPWGMPTLPDGSDNPLKDKDGPEQWQRDYLIELGQHIRDNNLLASMGLELKVWRSATASGHGVGKSALVAWLIQFFMSTRRDTRGVVTASTQFQLEDKTWPELLKWHNLLINKHWFVWTATTYSFAAYKTPEMQKNYRFTAATVSEQKTEAFAGLHNEGKTVVVIFDEASGIPEKIWEVAEGALTDGEAFFIAKGNPTLPEGEFADCFEKNAKLYVTRHVDSREVRHTNKSALQTIIDKYGIDSDQVKVRIKGQFPVQSYNGFIDPSAVHAAMSPERETVYDKDAPLIMAVDIANQGGDETVVGFRQGWDARTISPVYLQAMKHGEMVKRIAKIADMYQPDIIVIECVGIGIPLCDDLTDLHYKVYRAYPGAPVEVDYVNNRALWWAEMRDWLYEPTATLNEDDKLFDQLTKIQYALRRSDGKTLMESKKDMRDRGLSSPDRADMLMLTFAVKLARRDRNRHVNGSRQRRLSVMQDDPLNG